MLAVEGKMAPQDSTAELGKETLERSVDIAVREVRHRLEHRHLYDDTGHWFRQGWWKKDCVNQTGED